jgi:hypothetical protein
MFEFLTAMDDWLSLAVAMLTRAPLLMRAFTRARRRRRGTAVVRRHLHVLVVVVIRVEPHGRLVSTHYAVLTFTSAA